MSQPTLPMGWRWARLGQLCEIIGGGTPSRRVEKYFTGNIPWATPTDVTALASLEIADTATHITEEAIQKSSTRLLPPGCVLFTSRATIGFSAINMVPMCTNQGFASFQCGRSLNNYFLAYYLPHIKDVLLNLADGSIYKEVNKATLRDVEIPLPPLPIQERIAEILQGADSICRKRREALGLADAILTSTFIEMFGDPRENPREFKVTPLGELADVRSGVTKGRKLGGKETVEIPYLRVANVQDGYLDLSEVRAIEVLPQDVEKYHLEDGDILMIEGCGNPNYLGRGCIWKNQIPGCIHQNHIFRVRTNRERLLPEFLASLLRTKYANAYFLACAKNSSGLSNINSTQVKAFPVPEPPLPLQQNFASAVEQWEQIHRRLTDGLTESKRLFQGLMQQAFTGELTAAWEAEHAYEIATEQARREQLPRLVLLDFVRERQRRRPNEPVLITSLMKYVFLLQKEGTTGQTVYHFVPYKYGPFARELYQDLEALAAEGFVDVSETDEERTEIALVLSKEAAVQEALTELPEDLQADVRRVMEHYGDLSYNQLLAIVYEKHPVYATKSRLRHRKSS